MTTILRLSSYLLAAILGGVMLWVTQWWRSSRAYDEVRRYFVEDSRSIKIAGFQEMHPVRIGSLLPRDEWLRDFDIRYQILKVESLRTYTLVVLKKKCASSPPAQIFSRDWAHFIISGVTNETGEDEPEGFFLTPEDVTQLYKNADSVIYKVRAIGRQSFQRHTLVIKTELEVSSDKRLL
ncbi:MAG: hypothetical protein HOP19_05735 [Acidobacteria bacterium]|nr:hypothetical protein [Acidobacteriota bacterium]